MESVCLASEWTERLLAEGWSHRAANQFPLHWAASTLKLYDGQLNKLRLYCVENKIEFPPKSSAHIADFMCGLADSSHRPQSVLKSTLAAISCLYQAKRLDIITSGNEIQYLKDALVKSSTSRPMERSKVIPVKPFNVLFTKWPDNDRLSIKDLRMKAVTLMALTLMLRPSDIAPKGEQFDPEKNKIEKIVFCTKHIKFLQDGSIVVDFFGIKNDSKRTGFEVHLPAATNPKLDPCKTIQDYICRTASLRGDDGAVFLSLNQPYKAIDASTVSDILTQAISLAGLGGQGFKPKSFRPAAATAGVQMKYEPAMLMKTGRWKSESVFFDHYVHAKNDPKFTDDILNFEG